jgi:hypothetical protein
MGHHTYSLDTSKISLTGAGNGETLPTWDKDNACPLAVVVYDPAASRTGVILEKGTETGQVVTVINVASGAYSITFAATATSNVANGATSVISQFGSRVFFWEDVTGKWYPEI